MDIFKLFYDHDLRLDKTVERDKKDEVRTRLQDFMSPSPTFSKFYLTGTRLEEQQFGLNGLAKYNELLTQLDAILGGYNIHSVNEQYQSFSNAVERINNGRPMLLSEGEQVETDLNELLVGEESNVGHFKDKLREPLEEGHIIVYKEQAKNGFDLHLFSKENIYKQLFYPFKKLVDKNFRFFSVNSKRMRSERHFYFETWRLDRPPHGAEEVFTDTEL